LPRNFDVVHLQEVNMDDAGTHWPLARRTPCTENISEVEFSLWLKPHCVPRCIRCILQKMATF
jgi:hypothetical protein